VEVVAAALTALVGTPAVAFLLLVGQPLPAVALLLALPAFVLFVRYPLAGVLVWITLNQFVVQGSGGAERRVYWLVHRTLPLAVLALIVVVQLVGPYRRRLPRLGWPEAAMAGYVVASVLSIAYHADTPFATGMHLYDRVVAPMTLYLVVRLLRPASRDLLLVVAALGFVLLSQSAIGFVSWTAPGALPSAWLGREGTRTVGSLRHPNVYGTTMILAALLLLHAAATVRMGPTLRLLAVSGGVLGFFMVFLTLGRANWLAAVPAVVGLVVLHPRFCARFLPVVAVGLAVLVASGSLASQLEQARHRFRSSESERSALSRLPVVYASFRMIEAKPLTGWGYGDFDDHDRQFQRRVSNLIEPERDHASHNLYLTIGAEQGLPALGMFLFPALWWFGRTARVWRSLPAAGFVSRQLVGVLWLVVLAHLIANNFSNMKVVYGLGLFWLTLGLVASLVDEPAAGPSHRHRWLVGSGDYRLVPERIEAGVAR
jgi:O-antigen ligase